jgi:glucosamine--fructose-6-phosphate aminotransferase (isomerizing)
MRLENTYLWNEIHQQADVVRDLLDGERESVGGLVEAVRARGIRQVVIAARGSSDNAGRYAKYLLGAANRLVVSLATPSLFTLYEQPPDLREALVLGISQSGASPDLVAVLAEGRRQGALTAAITNHPNSELAAEADHVIDLHARREESLAATKTYTAELAAVALFSTMLGGEADRLHALETLPAAVGATLAVCGPIGRAAERYRYMRHCVVIGRGYNYATAFEVALKLKELTYTIAEPYSSADFLHGPVALIDRGFPVVVIAPHGALIPRLRELVATVNAHGAEVVAISDDNDILEGARIGLRLPAPVPEWLSPITAVVPGQYFAMHLAHTRGIEVDRPRSLTKVTETE